MATKYQGANWPLGEDIDRKKSDHHSGLFDLLGVYNGSDLLRDEFAKRIEAIKKNADLTPQGQRKQIAALVSELRTNERFMRFQRVIAREEQRAKLIKQRMIKADEPGTGPMSAKEMRYELARHAMITEFKMLPPEARHRVIHDRLDAGDVEYLNVIDSVPGLVSPDEGRRIDVLRMKSIDSQSLGELTDLLGPLNYDGQHEGARGALPVARQRLVELERWLKSEAEGSYSPSLAELLEARGLPAAQISDQAILLTRESAKHAEIFRAAETEARETGKALHVEPPTDNGAGSA